MNKNTSIPKVLWVAIVSLTLFGLFHFIVGFSKPVQFFAFALNIILIIGLFRLVKWAYFLSIIASITAPIILSFEKTAYFYLVLLINLSVLIPVLMSTKFFFSKSAKQPVSS